MKKTLFCVGIVATAVSLLCFAVVFASAVKKLAVKILKKA